MPSGMNVPERPGSRTDVTRGRADEASGALLLEDVGTPAGGTGTGEHGREHMRRYLGVVQHDRRPELDVRPERAVRVTVRELLDGRGLQRLSHFVTM